MTQPLKLVPSEDQVTLCKQAQGLLTQQAPVARLRHYRDTAGHPGFDAGLWGKIAGLGWIHLHLTEEEGGAGLPFADLCALQEQFGKVLAPEPWLSAVWATELLRRSSSHRRLLAGISEGLHSVAVAWQEHRYERTPKTTSCKRAAAGWHLSGTKRHVLDAPDAAYTLITAVDGDGAIRLFCVETATLEATREQRMDGRPAATLTFALELPATAEVTFYEGAELAWSQACDVASIALAAQMVGAAQAALDMTVEYLKIRQQFGVAIGTFQALQHRAAKMFIELELTRSAVIGAAAAVDAGSDELARYASLAKARACETLSLIAHEAIQLHGGIGVTDEHDIGLYLKRWRGDDALLGDASWHRQRWAELGGY